jgi:glycosyltransferase involved in cell wall biosynthesis
VHSPELAWPFILLRRKQKIVVHVHGIPEYVAVNSRYSFIRRSNIIHNVYRYLVNSVFKKADKLIWVSQDGLNRSSGDTWLKKKSVVLATSVDTASFKPLDSVPLKKKYKIPDDLKFIGFLGRLNNSKRPMFLLEAFKNLTNMRDDVGIIFIGDGELRGALEEQVVKLGLTNKAFFLGKIAHNEVAECINLINVGCFPSKVGEGFPLTVLEFLACGVPVVSAAVADLASIIKNHETGFLVHSENAADFAKRLDIALNEAPNMRENCIAITKDYSAKSIGTRLFNILNDSSGEQYKELK